MRKLISECKVEKERLEERTRTRRRVTRRRDRVSSSGEYYEYHNESLSTIEAATVKIYSTTMDNTRPKIANDRQNSGEVTTKKKRTPHPYWRRYWHVLTVRISGEPPVFRGKPRFCEKDTVKRRKEKNDERKQQTNGKPSLISYSKIVSWNFPRDSWDPICPFTPILGVSPDRGSQVLFRYLES
jgi:hypothetical protein